MLEPRNVAEKKLNAETHSYIGEIQLQKYGSFLDKYNNDLVSFRKKLTNTNNVRLELLTFDNVATEDVTLLKLVYSDNKLLTRILASLASICEETNLLVNEAQSFYVSLISYVEDTSNANDALKGMSEILEICEKIVFFINRSEQVIVLLLRQLYSLLGGTQSGHTFNSNASFPEPMDSLAQLLVSLVTLDTLFTLPIFKEHWKLFRGAVRSLLRTNSHNFSRDQLRTLEKHLDSTETLLLKPCLFKRILERCLEQLNRTTAKNNKIVTEFNAYSTYLLTELEKDEDNICFTQLWLQANALFVFQQLVFGNGEKKNLKRLLDINKKYSACTIVGNILWYPETFLLRQVPALGKLIDEKSYASLRSYKITNRVQNLTKESHLLCSQSCIWLINVNQIAKKSLINLDVKEVHEATDLLLDGLKLLKKISELLKWIANIHARENLPMTKSVLYALCKLVETLKCFQFVFSRNAKSLIYLILIISQQLAHKALSYVHAIRKSFTQEKHYKEQQLDVLSALNICENALKGPNTSQRLLVAKLSLSATGLSNDTLYNVRAVINRLELVCYTHKQMQKLCDCSFLFWHQNYIMPTYFSKLIESKVHLSRFYLILSALSDFGYLTNNNTFALIDNTLKNNLLQPINQYVETNLRLQTHLHLQLPSANPIKNYLPLKFHNFNPSILDSTYLSLKNETEHYLSAMFYNLTTVGLHNWQTYGQMRRLASLQYGLQTTEDNLPMQTLEQSLDVLEIMRNINVFVEKYLYNLNNQVFIEESSHNKHLNTINISHVANSIRTHGIGIMNTTVNVTYQFLQKKFFIFSQFMFDEQIKSKLLKDLRCFNEYKKELNQMYPYERAEKFNYSIKKLGLNSDGQSYLDLFRKLITHIGNAMGYVRMIRSGGRRCISNGTCFIPDFSKMEQLPNLLDQCDIPHLTKRVAASVVDDFKNLVENFEEATEYFKLLVKVFVPVFRDTKHMHLKNFYIIVPPLTINFVEHSLNCKERLIKKNRNEATFTDDGFCMGLAYIIELLEQENQLESLHWFQSVRQKFAQEKTRLLQKDLNGSKDTEKLQQTLSITEKRINSFEREFDLLYYNYNSARIFFQS